MVPDLSASNGTTEVRISGYGGQGIVLMGMLLGKAASLFDDKDAVFTQSYGPEARGGASCADVVVSGDPIDYPLVSKPDILVALFKEAYARYRPTLKQGGTLILDPDLVKPSDIEGEYHAIRATHLADELGRRIVANVVTLGFLIGHTQVVSTDAVLQAIETTVRPKFVDLNKQAFQLGLDQVQHIAR